MRTLLFLVSISVSISSAALAAGECFEPWTDLGAALGPPRLEGFGSLVAGTEVTLSLSQAGGNAAASLVVGLSTLQAPFKGGVLVPAPDVVVTGLATGAGGALDLVATWPTAVPAGTLFISQFWIADGLGPLGFSASNAIAGTAGEAPLPGFLPSGWIHGGDCGSDPLIQVEAYDADTYVLRASKCANFEGPFLYLFLGPERALLLDSGAGGIPVAATVRDLVGAWAMDRGLDALPLVVAHTHSHGDHVAGDGQFAGLLNTTVVGLSPAAVQAYFGFTDWPNDIVTFDLGGCRLLDVVAIPGHQSAHIAVYDRRTALLVTGDTLYPGFLFISGAVSGGNFAKYQDSIQRLVDFTADKPVTWVMGTHIEMTATPGVAYPYGTTVQPNEHLLRLERAHLLELRDAVEAMGSTPHTEVHDDFIITPLG